MNEDEDVRSMLYQAKAAIDREGLGRFVTESWRIEGLDLGPKTHRAEWIAMTTRHAAFLDEDAVTVELLCRQADVFAGAVLRDREGLDVRVGLYYPPPGGPAVRTELERLLGTAHQRTPYRLHQAYEHLHPFTDGNGRTGRLLWLWHMKQTQQLETALRLGFLHAWYYQSLNAGRDTGANVV